jgi:hypothetical protein
MRRRVLYHLCTICDFRKGGFSVMAIAAENIPSGPRYWLATNGHLKQIKAFLLEVLQMLEKRPTAGAREVQSSQLIDDLFRKFVLFQQPRVKEYWKILQSSIKQELMRTSLTGMPYGSPSMCSRVDLSFTCCGSSLIYTRLRILARSLPPSPRAGQRFIRGVSTIIHGKEILVFTC